MNVSDWELVPLFEGFFDLQYRGASLYLVHEGQLPYTEGKQSKLQAAVIWYESNCE